MSRRKPSEFVRLSLVLHLGNFRRVGKPHAIGACNHERTTFEYLAAFPSEAMAKWMVLCPRTNFKIGQVIPQDSREQANLMKPGHLSRAEMST